MLKQILSPLLIIASLLGMYFGAFLPLKKSQLFIEAYSVFNSQPTLQGLEESFNKALDFYSPVGQEEERRYLGSRLLSLFTKQIPEPVAGELVRYYESKFDFENEKNGGLNWTQNILILGNLRQAVWEIFKSDKDYQKAEEYYLKGLKLSPTRPQFLYGLQQLYKSKSETEKERQTTEKINALWPNK